MGKRKTYNDLRNEINPRSKRTKRTTMPSRERMEEFIIKNISKARAKLNYLKKTGYYKASYVAQEVNSQLRMLNRKYGFDEKKFYTGKSFKNKIKSGGDLNILYRAVNDILSINTREARAIYLDFKNRLSEEMEIDLDKNFEFVSKLSSDFHEVFAFLSYNDAVEFIDNPDKTTLKNVFKKIMEITEDANLNEKQQLAFERLKTKILNNESLSAQDLDEIGLIDNFR